MIGRAILPLSLLCAGLAAQPEAYNTAINLSSKNSPARAIDDGLRWLTTQQAENGSWNDDVLTTATVMLALLGDGHTLRQGLHEPQLRSATRWLRDQQDGETGRFGDETVDRRAQVTAACAMIETFGLSQYKLLTKNARLSVALLLADREDEFDPIIAATSVLALTAAADFGLTIPDDFSEVEIRRWHAALADHVEGDGPPWTAATAILPLIFLGDRPERSAALKHAIRTVVKYRPAARPAADYLHWASYGLFQADDAVWREWSREQVPALLKARNDDETTWGAPDSRLRETALNLLTLQAHYRYTAVLREDK